MKPFGFLEWAIALRYMQARRRERSISIVSTLSFSGIALGVAALIIVMAVMNGFRGELFNKILGVSGHILLQPLDSALTDYREVADRVAGVPGVVKAIPFVEGQAFVSGPGGATGAMVRGVSKADFDKLDFVSGKLVIGSDAEFGAQKGAIIGTRLATTLGVTLGDPITLMTQDGPVTPFGQTPQIDNYPVEAIFEVGMSEYDGQLVYLPLDEAQLYFGQEDRATAIEVYAEDPDDMEALRAAVGKAAERPLYMIDWRDRNKTFFSALVVERNVMFIILTLVVLVAAMNVVSNMTMLVTEKTRDIAIMRTIGATRGSILRVFLIVGLSIGVGGTLIGLALGALIATNIENIRQAVSSLFNIQLFPPELYFLTQVPSDMDSFETGLVVAIAMVLSLLATVYPAWKAANTDPVVSLKAE